MKTSRCSEKDISFIILMHKRIKFVWKKNLIIISRWSFVWSWYIIYSPTRIKKRQWNKKTFNTCSEKIITTKKSKSINKITITNVLFWDICEINNNLNDSLFNNNLLEINLPNNSNNDLIITMLKVIVFISLKRLIRKALTFLRIERYYRRSSEFMSWTTFCNDFYKFKTALKMRCIPSLRYIK